MNRKWRKRLIIAGGALVLSILAAVLAGKYLDRSRRGAPPGLGGGARAVGRQPDHRRRQLQLDRPGVPPRRRTPRRRGPSVAPRGVRQAGAARLAGAASRSLRGGGREARPARILRRGRAPTPAQAAATPRPQERGVRGYGRTGAPGQCGRRARRSAGRDGGHREALSRPVPRSRRPSSKCRISSARSRWSN